MEHTNCSVKTQSWLSWDKGERKYNAFVKAMNKAEEIVYNGDVIVNTAMDV